LNQPKPPNHGEEHLNPGHQQLKSFLRFVGPAMLCVGLLFMAIGLIDFFRAMSSHSGPPKLFWCLFIGMPMMFFGGAITKFAFMGSVLRYMSAESSPVAKDTFNYMAAETKEGVREVASAIREGIVGESSEQICCRSCKEPNDRDARFCNGCGIAIATEKDCPSCEAPNDYDARFCDFCGSKF